MRYLKHELKHAADMQRGSGHPFIAAFSNEHPGTIPVGFLCELRCRTDTVHRINTKAARRSARHGVVGGGRPSSDKICSAAEMNRYHLDPHSAVIQLDLARSALRSFLQSSAPLKLRPHGISLVERSDILSCAAEMVPIV
jgi:hypothetical protein